MKASEQDIRNTLRILASDHSYRFEDASEVRAIDVCRLRKWCTFGHPSDSKHILKQKGSSGRGIGVKITEVGKQLVREFVDDRRFK